MLTIESETRNIVHSKQFVHVKQVNFCENV